MRALPNLFAILTVAASLSAQMVLTRANGFTHRYVPAVAYESNTGYGYLFGGVDGQYVARNDTWRHDEGQWLPVATVQQPPAFPHPIGCTWATHGMLVFTGGQTWLFDGVDWTQIVTAHTPLALTAMAYDPLRGFVTGFHGANQGASGSTWEFDGQDWLQRFPLQSPPPFAGSMAWEPNTQRLVLAVEAYTNGTRLYSWDGTNWTSGALIGIYHGFSIATAPGNGGVMLSGGFIFPFYWGSNILWNGNQATVLNTPESPTGRESSHSWFDPVRNRTVVTNGSRGNAGTWHWNGSQWSRPPLGTMPPWPNASGYDSWRGVLLQFGGTLAFGSEHNQLWARGSNRTWNVLGTGPLARYGQACAFDSWRGRLIVFGGAHFDAGGGSYWVFDPFGTHEWDGTAWHSTFAPSTSPWNLQQFPYGRRGSAMAFDRQRGRAVMFGGNLMVTWAPNDRNDTWEWDGTTWTLMQPSTVPPAGYEPRMFFDASRGQCVLQTAGFWAWTGTDWVSLPIPPVPGTAPPPRAAYDAARDVYVAPTSSGLWELHNGAWQLMSTSTWSGDPQYFDLGLGRFVGFDAQGWLEFGDPAAATLRPFGDGCGRTSGAPVLHGEEPPRLGHTLTLHIARLPAAGISLGVLGDDSPTFLGAPLPIDLTALGMPACLLHTAIAAHELVAGAHWAVAIPNATTLLGATFRLQAFPIDPILNGLGFAATNGVALRVGP